MGKEEGERAGEGGVVEREELLGGTKKSKGNKVSFF